MARDLRWIEAPEIDPEKRASGRMSNQRSRAGRVDDLLSFDFKFRRERSVLIFARRTGQGQLVAAALDFIRLTCAGSRRVRGAFQFCRDRFRCLIHGVCAIERDDRRIGLARIIGFHSGNGRAYDDLAKSTALIKRQLSRNCPAPVVFLLAVLVLIENRRKTQAPRSSL